MKTQRLVVLLAFTGLLVLGVVIGCTSLGDGFLLPGSGNELGLFPPRFMVVYGESGIPQSLDSFKVDATTGALTEAAGMPILNHTDCCGVWLDIDPQSRFAYVPNTDSTQGGAFDNTVSVYKIDQTTGALTEVSGSPFASGGTDPIAARVHPSGNFLYVNNRTSPNIAVFSINTSTGALTAVGTPVTVSGQLVTLAIDPLGRFLYASACGTSCDTTSGQPDQVFAFRIDSSTGALTAAGTAATGAFPRTAVVDALGNHLYVTCGPDGTADVISAFDINTSTGGLTAITGPFTTGNLPFGAAIPPGDSVLVTGDRTDNTIRAWRIGGNGGLTLATGSPVTPTPTMDYEHGVFSDPSGKFIYVLDADNDQIRIFTVSSAGALAETTGSQVPTVGFPTSLAVGH